MPNRRFRKIKWKRTE